MARRRTSLGAGKAQAAWVTLLLLAAVAPVAADVGEPLNPHPWSNANRDAWTATKALYVWLSGSKDAPDDALPANTGWTAARIQAIDESIAAWNTAQADFGGLTLHRLPGLPGQAGATPMAEVRDKTDISINLADFRLGVGWGGAAPKAPSPGYMKRVVLIDLSYRGEGGTLDANGVKHLALHELGHALGSAHITSSPLMDGTRQNAAGMNAATTTIGPDEKALMKKLWGSEARKADSRVEGDYHQGAGVFGGTHLFKVEGKAMCGTVACTKNITRVLINLSSDNLGQSAQTIDPPGWTGTVVWIPREKRWDATTIAVAVFTGGRLAPGTHATFGFNSEPVQVTAAFVHTISETNDLDSYIVKLAVKTVPGPPVLEAVAGPGNGQASLSWQPPFADGGKPLLRYTLYRDNVQHVSTVDETVLSYVDNGLAPATTYCYKVAAVNAVGEGVASNERCIRTPSLPGRPGKLNAVAGPNPGDVQLSWLPPADDGGKPIHHYTVYRDGGAIASTVDGSTFTYTDSPPNPSAPHCYKVTASNSIGEGLASDAACLNAAGEGSVTRSFSILALAELEMKEGGTGVYSPTSACPTTVFGLRPNVPTAVYYADGRAITNLQTGETLLFGGQTVPLAGQQCPIPGTGGGVPLTIAVAATNLYGSYQGIVADQLVCLSDIGVDCFPDPDAALATLAHCGAQDAAFTTVNDGKGDLGGLGGRSIACADWQDATTYFDGASGGSQGYCKSWFFGTGNWGTDFCVIQAEDGVPLGNGRDDTGYLVTCLSAPALVVGPLGSHWQTFQSHDWILVLDLDGTPGNWFDALQGHTANGLQGWHDLGGDNGVPCPGGSVPPARKVDDLPVFPTPLSPH